MRIKKGKKILSLTLAVSMIVTALPGMAVYAESGNGQEECGVITSFRPLVTGVTSQTVLVGTDIDDLNLPDTLRATVTTTIEVQHTEASPANASEDSEVIVTETVTIPVEWQSEPYYDCDSPGEYTFTPELPDEYTIEDGTDVPEINVTVAGHYVLFAIEEDENSETILYLPAGAPCAEEDLLEGVSAEDEAGNPVSVTVKDIGGLDLSDPQPPDDAVYPPIAYVITYEGIHPVTGESFTAERSAYVTVGIMDLMSIPGSGIFDVSEGKIVIGPDPGGSGDFQVSYGVSSVAICSASVPVTITGTWGGAIGTGESVILIDGVTAEIVLDDVSVDVSSITGACALEMENGADIRLTLSGSNDLKSGQNRSGIELGSQCNLDIEGTDTTILNAVGGVQGTGIGGSHCGNIIINGGQINATGKNYYSCGIGGFGIGSSIGEIIINDGIIHAETLFGYGNCGAAIGSSMGGTCGDITINGGTITTNKTGGSSHYTNGAGIGSGYQGSCGDIIITGGTIYASGDSGLGNSKGSGIGDNCGDIIISGGRITAIGGTDSSSMEDGTGIGSGKFSTCGDIIITGGTITAAGGAVAGAGIGTGNSTTGACGNISISGGTIIATGGTDTNTMDIGGGNNPGSVASVEITGGSVRPVNGANKVTSPLPGNGATRVYLNTLTVGGTSSPVANTDITGCDISDYSYGIHDVVTDAAGNVYFWLPVSNSDAAVTVAAGGGRYSNTYTRTGVESMNLIIAFSVRGTLSGGSVSGLSVSYTLNGGGTQTTTTDMNGNYRIADVSAGTVVMLTPPVQVWYDVSPAGITTIVNSADSVDNDFLYTQMSPTATPTANPGGGTYAATQIVTLSTTTAGATIYYTLDGSTPTATSAFCSSGSQITVPMGSILNAYAVSSNPLDSGILTETYIQMGTVDTPTAAPGGGTYASTQNVTLSTTTAGATIYYTLDGSIPTAASSSCTSGSQITVSMGATLNVYATAAGLIDSGILTANYVQMPTAAIPAASPPGGMYAGAQTVTLSTTTSGATIYYTLDGTTPTTGSRIYSGPFTVQMGTTLKACAVAAVMIDSAVLTEVYTQMPMVAEPTASPSGGLYEETSKKVELSTITANATIYYTLDGSNPADSTNSGRHVYSAPIMVPMGSTLKAYAVRTGMIDSSILSAEYIQLVSTPIASLPSGVYTETQTVILTTTTAGAAIYYTLDGTDPTPSSTAYSNPVSVPKGTTLKAYAMAAGMADSAVMTETYEAAYIITASTGKYGSITPSGSIAVKEGDTQTYQIVPEKKYRIAAATIDGVQTTSIGRNYSFCDVKEDHSIYIVFERDESSSGENAAGIGSTSLGQYNTYVSGVDGNWVSLDDTSENWQFVLNSGSQLTDTWALLKYQHEGTEISYFYHFGTDSLMDYGWFMDSNGYWYYLSEEHDGWFGHMKTGWHFDPEDQRTYYFDTTDGYMLTGWRQIGGSWYYFSNRMVEDVWVYNESRSAWEFSGSTARPYGSMYIRESTPDGYYVDESGKCFDTGGSS